MLIIWEWLKIGNYVDKIRMVENWALCRWNENGWKLGIILIKSEWLKVGNYADKMRICENWELCC